MEKSQFFKILCLIFIYFSLDFFYLLLFDINRHYINTNVIQLLIKISNQRLDIRNQSKDEKIGIIY